MTSTVTSAERAPATSTAKLALVGLVLAAVVIFAGNYHVQKGENGGTTEGLSTAVICAVVAVVLFGLVVPRLRHRAGATVALGVLTFLSLAVFWSGVTPILAAATLAVSAGQAPVTRRTTIARGVAVVAGTLSVVVTLAQSHLF